MKKLIYIIIVIAIALTACEKTLDFPFEYKKPKLVLNCVLSNTSEIDFSISRSMHILDTKEIVKISDADVIIFEDGNPLQVVPVSDGEGNYHAAYIPKAGHTYKFQVSKDGFETIESEVTMPNPTTINSISGKQKSNDDGYYYGDEFDVSLNFSDIPDNENYYMIYVTSDLPEDMKEYFDENYMYSVEDLFDKNYKLNLECNDISVSSGYGGTLLYMADEVISGENYTIKFSAQDYRDIRGIFYGLIYEDDDYYYKDGEEGEGEDDDEGESIEDLPFYREYEYKLIVHLRSVNKDYYQYQKSYDLYIENDGNPFSEPTLVKTNIKNGLGILGAAGEVTDTIRFTIKNPYLEEQE
jgi:hypothetical protein